MSHSFSQSDSGADEHAEILLFQALNTRPEERGGFLDAQCGLDTPLRGEVEGLLRDYEKAGSFLSVDATVSMELKEEFARLQPETEGDRIGPYKLLQQIGEGGFGVVWMAEQDQPVRRRVALKILKPGMDTKEVVARFEQERQALAVMQHPNIATVLDAGVTQFGRPYFVMELVRGIKITQYCDEAQLTTHARLQLFIAVCHAVQHAHQKGIIHRDLKPSNILVTLHDGVPVPKVIDFGVAKAIQQQRLSDFTVFTRFEQMIGTPLYMSPEQAEMSGLDIDTRSDIYSLGVLLYELLTGRTPFDPGELLKQGLDEIRRVIREDEPQKPSTFVSTLALDLRNTLAQHRQSDHAKFISQIRGDLDWIVMKALEKDRNRRYGTANAFAQDIQRHLQNEPVEARPATRFYRFRRFAKRNKTVFAAGSGIAAALVLGLAASTWMFFKEKQARERAVSAEQQQVKLRQAAEEQERKATAEANKSSQVARFLTDMLQGVGPSVALGRDTKMLREILDKTAERVNQDLKDQPEVQAELLHTLGEVYDDLMAGDEAKQMFAAALSIREKIFGREHPLVGKSMVRLATHVPVPEAEAMRRKALAMQIDSLGPEHPEVATTLDRLAFILGSAGKYQEAQDMARRSVEMRKKLLGPNNIAVADSLFTLAQIIDSQGSPNESEPIHREQLAFYRKLLGPEHPKISSSLMNLGISLRRQAKWAEAAVQFREALDMTKRLWGDTHDLVSNIHLRLMELFLEEDNFPEAEKVIREGLDLRKRISGKDADVAAWMGNLGMVLKRQGKLEEAELEWRKVEEIHRRDVAEKKKLPGLALLEAVTPIHKLAELFLITNKLVAAEEQLREALEIRKKVFGEEHKDVAFSLRNVAINLIRQARVDEAINLLGASLEMHRNLLGEDDPILVPGRSIMANLLHDLGRYVEAESFCRENLSAVRKYTAALPDDLESALNLLAENCYRQENYSEAEGLYREIFDSRTKRLPAHEESLLASQASLARTLSDWAWRDRPDPADPDAHLPKDVPPTAITGVSTAHQRALEAEKLLRKCLVWAPTHWRHHDVKSRLGGALLSKAVTTPENTGTRPTEKYLEAEKLLIEGHSGLSANKEVEARYNSDAVVRLVRLYEAWGKADKVAEWNVKLAAFGKSKDGVSPDTNLPKTDL